MHEPRNIDSKVIVETTYKLRTRSYSASIIFDLKLLAINPNSWIAEILDQLANESRNRPLNTSNIKIFLQALKILSQEKSAISILNLTTNVITNSLVLSLFSEVENIVISKENIADSVKGRLLTYFRMYILHYVNVLKTAEQINRMTVGFKTTFYFRKLPRNLISDQVNPNKTLEEEVLPIDSLPHAAGNDLRKKVKERINSDLNQIIDACIAELKFYSNIRNKLVELEMSCELQDPNVLSKILKIDKGIGVKSYSDLARIPPEDHIAMSLKLIKLLNLSSLNRAFVPHFHQLNSSLHSHFSFQNRPVGKAAHQLIFLPYRICSDELLAILVLLLAYTGWNTASLLEMTSIEKIEGGFELQGFKSKTDDDTPPFTIDASMPYAVEAVNLLLWNAASLKQLGWLSHEESRFWFAYTASNTRMYKHQYIGYQDRLKEFIKKYDLPNFSLDQIRNQVLMNAHLKGISPDAVRRIAGHADLSTTGHYLDQNILKRLNKAINREFQFRFENTVIFRLNETETRTSLEIHEKYVDHDLLIPVGDGSSCNNPYKPPIKNYLEGEICSGKSCHEGDGCSNRVLKITNERLEELVRTKKYYANNWGRLYADNPEAFKKHHANKLLFAHGLYEYIENTIYAHVLYQVEKLI